MQGLALAQLLFGEALRITQDNLDSKNFYAFNPAFDKLSAEACNM